MLKRLLDVVAASVLLVLLLPLCLVIVVAIKLTSRGPALYRWRVVGLGGRPFESYKFRSMYDNAVSLRKALEPLNEMRGPVFKIRNDPRVTPVGRILRRYSLDEIPQLISVLKGDMSLVGPRPPLREEYEQFDEWHRQKLQVRPGMTCLWQVSGRNRIRDFDEWVKLDLEYIEQWSLWLDLKILLRTIGAVLRGEGV
ncbi:MAG: sugar transferase [Chloroflexi bacterium]|nr:sugar transferase [Chloroflexota bacterium]